MVMKWGLAYNDYYIDFKHKQQEKERGLMVMTPGSYPVGPGSVHDGDFYTFFAEFQIFQNFKGLYLVSAYNRKDGTFSP